MSHNIEAAARKIEAAAPKKKGQYVYAALIPWKLIEELRRAIDYDDTQKSSAVLIRRSDGRAF